MPRPHGRLLLATAGCIAVLGVAASLVLLRNVDQLRPRLESAASDVFGVRVRVGGRVGLGIGRGLLVRLEDVQVAGPGDAVLVTAEQARLWIEPLALLRGSVRLRRVELVRPTFTFETRADSTRRTQTPRGPGALLRALDGASLSVVGAGVRYADAAAGVRVLAYNASLTAGRLRIADRRRPCDPRGLSLAAEFACDSVHSRGASASALRLVLRAEHGVFAVEPISLTVLGGRASGALRLDFSGAVPRYEVRGSLGRFRIEQLLALKSRGPMVRGTMDLAAQLSMSGTTPDQLLRSSVGAISLRGAQLTLVGDDLDRRLSRFESSQGFNLVDVGAAVLAGPVGLAVTRSYTIAGMFRGSGGDSPIESLASDWTIAGGVARARDVAMATRRHRIALRGDLDFVAGRYAGVIVAVVNAHGCATAHQSMHGDFAHPVVERPRLITSLAGPVLHLYRQARSILPESPCATFYSGSVAPPG